MRALSRKEELSLKMEAILKFIEAASKYGIPIPLILALIAIAFCFTSNMKWVEREKYYYDLLDALGKWKNSLSDMSIYYREPGSEYRDDKITVIADF